MNFGCMTGVEYKGFIYFSLRDGNGLFRLNTKNGSIELVAVFNVNFKLMPLYQFASIFENTAWFIPGGAEKIAKINLETLEIEYIDIPFVKRYDPTDGVDFFTSYITGTLYKGHYLCCNPRSVDVLLIIDMKTHQVTHVNNVNKPLVNGIFTGGFAYKGNFYLCKKTGINDTAFDLNGNAVVRPYPKVDELHINVAVNSGEKIYAMSGQAGRSKLIVFDDEQSDSINADFLTNEFCGGVELDNIVLFFPLTGKALIINKETHEAQYVNETWSRYSYETQIRNRMSAIASEKHHFITTGDSGFIFELDENGSIVNSWHLIGKLQKYIWAEIFKKQTDKLIETNFHNIIDESSTVSLDDFVFAVGAP